MRQETHIPDGIKGKKHLLLRMVVFCVFIWGCGYKTDLNPPEPRRVERVTGLNSEIMCNAIRLEWLPALFDTRGEPLNEPAYYLVLRKRGEPLERVSGRDQIANMTNQNSGVSNITDDDEAEESENNTMAAIADDEKIESTPMDDTLPTESDIIPPEYAFSLVAIVPGKTVPLTTTDMERVTIQWKDTGVPSGPAMDTAPIRFRKPRYFHSEKDESDNGLIPGYTYSYSIIAVDSKSVTSQPSALENTPWVIIPGPPDNLESNVALNQVELTWNAPSVDCAGNAIETTINGYEIFRSGEEDPGQFQKLLTVSDIDNLTETDTTMTMDSIYHYKIRAIIEPSVPGEFSEIMTVDTTNIFPPEPPSQLSGAVRPGGVFLNWRYEGEAEIAGYRIYRQPTDQADFELLNPCVLIQGRMYIDETVETGETYTYRVTSVDRSVNGNESPPGNTWTVTVH
jgi:hypothetical protein